MIMAHMRDIRLSLDISCHTENHCRNLDVFEQSESVRVSDVILELVSIQPRLRPAPALVIGIPYGLL